MNPKDKIHSSWQPIIDILDKDENLRTLRNEILPNCTYYPSRENIFNVFQTPVQDIKVVILGQDPYPNAGQAIGFAFAVSEETNKPVSFKIIEKEVGVDLNKTLSNWTDQGVFLLNTALTVEAKKAGSHLKYWENFTRELVRFISQNNDVIWVFWGAKAQAYEGIVTSCGAKPGTHIIKAPHPAAESYSGGKAGFYGCKHFSLINEILETQNKSTIVW